MAALASLLPKPKHQTLSVEEDDELEAAFQSRVAGRRSGPPPYGMRKGWTPSGPEDYGDGGAFPEIHIAQYPYGIGKKEDGRTLTLQVDAQGNVEYDAIVRQGQHKNAIVHSKFQDLLPKDISEEDPSFQRPDEDEVRKATEETRLALEKLSENKLKSALPKGATVATRAAPTLVRYTPSQQGDNTNSGAMSRVIRMAEMPVDPMEPPKFRHKRVPRGPPSPPVPVMHSPPRKVTVQEQNEWKIPPCISNWKNSKGFVIPLDKRLAADGRGLQETTINSNFAKLSEALVIADQQARDEIARRATVQKKIAQKEKEIKEDKLRQLAQQAREQSAALGKVGRGDTSHEAQAEREREEIRRDKRHEIERELRLNNMGKETKEKVMARSADRDISEKIALGLAQPQMSKEMMYDQRLFNQSQGFSSGFADDEAYNLYDKPLFAGTSTSTIYRPSKNKETEYGSEADMAKLMDTSKFQADKGFQGADKAQVRSGPVEFEREEADPFGLDQFLTDAKKGSKRGLDAIGERGQLHANAGNGSSGESSGRSKLNFESGGERESKKGRY